MTNSRRKEQQQEDQAIVMGVAMLCLYLGFRAGWTAGRRDLIHGITRAQRIISHLQE